jgi:hypothetical protein
MHTSNTGHKKLPLECHYPLHYLGPQFGLLAVGYKSEENVRERYYKLQGNRNPLLQGRLMSELGLEAKT